MPSSLILVNLLNRSFDHALCSFLLINICLLYHNTHEYHPIT
nr:MAG TPA: hypothetical protein [Bacteriophage sp.]